MLPGMPVLMGQGPFSLSGSWENVSDGWVIDGLDFDAASARTGSYGLLAPAGAGTSRNATYTIPDGGGLTITASVYHKRIANTPARTLSYRLGGSGSWTTIQTVTNATTTFAQLSGSFSAPQGQMVEIRAECDIGGAFDDWAISGAFA